MKWHVLLHQNTTTANHNMDLVGVHKGPNNQPTSKLDRLPEYFRDTMEWFLGRSRRKPPDGKENHVSTTPQRNTRVPGSVDGCGLRSGPRKSHSADFTLCDSVTNDHFRQLVTLPRGVLLNEWLATHALSFFHHINALHGAVAEFCTSDSCPVMNGPGQMHQQPWVDEKGKKWKYAAPQYVDCVMSFIERVVITDDSGFPTKYGQPFGSNFDLLLRRICRLLWHVMAHIHYAHWEHLTLIGLRPQAAALLIHFASFCDQFAILDPKDNAMLDQLALGSRPSGPASAPPTAPTESEGAVQVRMDTSEPPSCLQENSCNRKSGSWGGSQSPSYLNTLQPCAQTA